MWEDVKKKLRPYRAYRAARLLWNLSINSVMRRDYVIRWRRPTGLFQYRSLTRTDRYPEIFGFVRTQLPPSARLLSFGCATGEEVFSLRTYFPAAVIRGL